MPTLLELKNAALDEIAIHAQPKAFPQIDDNEVSRILDAALRASIWLPSTPYSVGAVVVPTVRNGHRYRCVEPGTSGLIADEPSWPTFNHTIVTDGEGETQIVWEEFGTDYGSLYDLRKAIHDCWMLKASKVAHIHDSRRSQSAASRSQIYEQCIKQAERFRPFRIS
jgi:hypothetical protein